MVSANWRALDGGVAKMGLAGLLANFSLNPGTFYSPPAPFTVAELTEMRDLGLNTFTAFPATIDYANDSDVAVRFEEPRSPGVAGCQLQSFWVPPMRVPES